MMQSRISAPGQDCRMCADGDFKAKPPRPQINTELLPCEGDQMCYFCPICDRPPSQAPDVSK